MMLDVRTKRGADVYTDHQLVMATFQLKIMAIQRRPRSQMMKHIDIDKLKTPGFKENYVRRIDELRQTRPAAEWNQVIVEAAKKHPGTQEKSANPLDIRKHMEADRREERDKESTRAKSKRGNPNTIQIQRNRSQTLSQKRQTRLHESTRLKC